MSTLNAPFRAFIALPLISKEKSNIQRLIKKIQRDTINKSIQWTFKKNFHITIQFLGNITPSKGQVLIKKIKEYVVLEKSLTLETKKLILLPSKNNPKVLALAIKKIKPLMELAALIYRLGTGLNIKLSSRAYLPHLTLGYLEGNDNFLNLIELIVEPVTLHPKKIVLFESTAETISKYIPRQSIIL